MYNRLFLLLILISRFQLAPSFAQPLASGKTKFLGNVIGNAYSIRTDFRNYWNQVTAENAGKWGSVESSQDSYSWTQLDLIYNFALTNGFLYKHHAFVWGQQYPTWITGLDSANQRAQVEEWIRLCAQRYPHMNMVDVVNQPFHAVPPFKNALGGDGATGWDWVVTSFQWARQYCDSNAQLILNEYSVLHSNSVTDNYLKLIDTLKVRGLIDAIGIQCHYFELRGQSPSTIDYNLKRLAATGLPIYISEFDINEAVDSIQLQNYRTSFPIFWENPGVKGITLWGYVYGYIWQPDAYLINDRNARRPAFNWLISYMNNPYRPTLVSPVNIVGTPRNPILIWHSNDTSVTTYRVQLSASSTFSSFLKDTVVTDTLLQIDSLAANLRIYWRVSASNNLGTSEYSIIAQFITGTQIVSVGDPRQMPGQFALMQNYPNPFNPTTVISYQLPATSHISLKVYNLLGQEVATLFEGIRQPGSYEAAFDGSKLASGVYFYRMQANPKGASNFVETKKLIFLK